MHRSFAALAGDVVGRGNIKERRGYLRHEKSGNPDSRKQKFGK
jgi:hypothetical protein